MKPSDIAQIVECQPGFAYQLDKAVSGLAQFPRFAALIKANPVIRLKAGDVSFTGLPESVGGQYIHTRSGRLQQEILLNFDGKTFFRSKHQSDDRLGFVGNVVGLLPESGMDTGFLVHEFAHHIQDLKFKVSHHDPVFSRIFNISRFSMLFGAVSNYATQDGPEWFAETVTAYLFFPEELKKFDLPTFNAIQSLEL